MPGTAEVDIDDVDVETAASPAGGETVVTPALPETSQEEAEAKESSLLDALRKKHDADDADSAWSTEEEEDIKQAKADAEAAKATRGEDGKFKPSAEKQYERAKQALLRDGTMDEEEIDAMEPEKVIAKGTIAAKRQADLDKKLASRAATSEAVGTEVEADDDAPPADAEAKSSSTTPGDDELLGAVEPFSKAVTGLFGDDFGVGDALKTALKGMQAQMQSQISKVLADNARLQESLNVLTDKSVKKGIVERFPQAETPDNWQAVTAKAKTLLDKGVAGTREQALREAALSLYGEEALAAAKNGQAKLNAAKSRGQPHSATRTAPPAKGAAGEDADSIALAALQAGESVSKVRAKFAG